MELGLGIEQAFRNSVNLTDDVQPEILTAESLLLLEDGISRILSEWRTLRYMVARELRMHLAKEYINSYAIRLKSKQFDEIHSEIFNWFTQSNVPLETRGLCCLISQTIRRSYLLTFGDGSPLKVASKLMDLYQECLQKSASRRLGEQASLKSRRPGQGRRAYGARQAPY